MTPSIASIQSLAASPAPIVLKTYLKQDSGLERKFVRGPRYQPHFGPRFMTATQRLTIARLLREGVSRRDISAELGLKYDSVRRYIWYTRLSPFSPQTVPAEHCAVGLIAAEGA